MPQFRVRTLLLLTALVAIGLLSLVKPTALWLAAWPFIVSGMCVVVFARTAFSRRETVFWASFIIGMMTFLAMAAMVELIGALCGDSPPSLIARGSVWVWELLQNTPAPNTAPPGALAVTGELISFTVSLHVITAMVWSALITFAAQLLFTQRDNP
jgi:hypothetical protein